MSLNFTFIPVLVVPIAALHKFYMSPKLPESVNYGMMGTILAHEMTHAFDDKVRKELTTYTVSNSGNPGK